jgi:hypothetical protein
MLALGMLWLTRRRARRSGAGEGEGYGPDDEATPAASPPRTLREHAQGEGYDVAGSTPHGEACRAARFAWRWRRSCWWSR